MTYIIETPFKIKARARELVLRFSIEYKNVVTILLMVNDKRIGAARALALPTQLVSCQPVLIRDMVGRGASGLKLTFVRVRRRSRHRGELFFRFAEGSFRTAVAIPHGLLSDLRWGRFKPSWWVHFKAPQPVGLIRHEAQSFRTASHCSLGHLAATPN